MEIGSSRQAQVPRGSVAAERAVGELLLRLRRARSRPGVDHAALLGDADRAVFKDAMDKRKQVLESAIGISVAQFGLYRFAIRSAPRPIRVVFGFGCVSATMQYTRHRASSVTHDLLTSILNLPEESSLGNEARIILANLEGPEGPFYTSVVDESLRKQIYERALSQPLPADSSDVHPQLSLQPRLLSDMGSTPKTPASKSESTSDAPMTTPGATERTIVYTGRRDWRNAEENIDQYPALPLDENTDNLEVIPFGATPYDFAAAARGQTQEHSSSDGVRDASDGQDSAESFITPAQRRAAERAQRRHGARATRMSQAGE